MFVRLKVFFFCKRRVVKRDKKKKAKSSEVNARPLTTTREGDLCNRGLRVHLLLNGPEKNLKSLYAKNVRKMNALPVWSEEWRHKQPNDATLIALS